MKININNYEAYLLDHFEGNLTEALSVELMHFLEENPQIEVDWNGFEPMTLDAGYTAFENKQQLYRTDSVLMGLTKTDFLMVKQQEEGLTEDENWQLEGLLTTNPSLEKEVKQMACARLAPGNELFAAKNSIKRLDIWPLLTLQRARQVAAILVVAAMASTLWLVKPFVKPYETFVAATPPTTNQPVKKTVADESAKLTASPAIQQTANQPTATEALPSPLQAKVEATSAEPMLAAMQPMAPLKPRRVINLQPAKKINAYELGVNHMMPLYVALLQNEKKASPETLIAEAPRNLSLLEGGIKVLNALSGSDIRLNKELDNSGKVVAYSLQTENAIFNKQVRR